MIWDRFSFKAQAKVNFQKNYWTAVAVSVILALVLGALGGMTWRYDFDSGDIFRFVTTLGAAAFGGGLFSLALTLLVCNPFEVGACRFFMENREGTNVGFNRVGFGFTADFGNVVLTRFLEKLYVFLWGLLFVVPGIVRSLGYFCVPFILAENPGMEHNRVLELSRAMTMGHKGDIFVTYLSFLGWMILAGITGGIVGVFYSFPYLYATNAEMYAFLRQNALSSGLVTQDDLPGFPVSESNF
jgi:uncharacterized membrane protein